MYPLCLQRTINYELYWTLKNWIHEKMYTFTSFKFTWIINKSFHHFIILLFIRINKMYSNLDCTMNSELIAFILVVIMLLLLLKLSSSSFLHRLADIFFGILLGLIICFAFSVHSNHIHLTNKREIRLMQLLKSIPAACLLGVERGSTTTQSLLFFTATHQRRRTVLMLLRLFF